MPVRMPAGAAAGFSAKLPGPPGPPFASDVSSDGLVLSWSPPASSGAAGPLQGYRILAQAGGTSGFTEVVSSTGQGGETAHRLRGLLPETWYEFRVAAVSANGVGAPSRSYQPAGVGGMSSSGCLADGVGAPSSSYQPAGVGGMPGSMDWKSPKPDDAAVYHTELARPDREEHTDPPAPHKNRRALP